MILKIRSYPLSNKLTILNGMLLCLNIFLTLGVFIICIMILGGPGANFSGMDVVLFLVPPIIFFIVVHIFINKHTDKKYIVIVANYEELCAKLINQNPDEAKDIQLTRPATVTFTRLSNREAHLAKLKYIINGTEYKLKNGETITFTTNSALNTIQIKSIPVNDANYFTVADGEQLTIQYCTYYLKNVQRN